MADPTDDDPSPTPPAPAETIDEARRRLLSLSRYVPPAVIGILVLDGMGCQPAPSCNPDNCNPNNGACGPDDCNPSTGQCGPDNNPNN